MTGTAVAVDPLVVCGECGPCRSGNPNRLCETNPRSASAAAAAAPSSPPCRRTRSTRFPKESPQRRARSSSPSPSACAARRRGRVTSGDRVAILGAGTIGLMSILTARAAGASSREHRRAASPPAGDRHGSRCRRCLRGRGRPGPRARRFVVRLRGRDRRRSRFDALRRGAPCPPGRDDFHARGLRGSTPLPALDFSLKELELIGSNCYGRVGPRTDFAIAIDLLRKHRQRAYRARHPPLSSRGDQSRLRSRRRQAQPLDQGAHLADRVTRVCGDPPRSGARAGL